MSSLESHPTVIQAREAQAAGRISSPPMMTREDLERLCRAAGADDCGFVTIDDPALDDQRHLIQTAYPFARTLISFVKRMHHEAVRSPMRSYANLEFHSGRHNPASWSGPARKTSYCSINGEEVKDK